ncbi:MAG: hypothetical protein WBB98_08055, partial [Xanthobacteraceae bacterium]
MKHNWLKTHGRRRLKCMAVALHDTGLRGSALLARFVELVPRWKLEFDGPISDNAVLQRADKGRRYVTEWPENNPLTAPHWKAAVRDVRRGRCTFDFEAARARLGDGPAQPRR